MPPTPPQAIAVQTCCAVCHDSGSRRPACGARPRGRSERRRRARWRRGGDGRERAGWRCRDRLRPSPLLTASTETSTAPMYSAANVLRAGPVGGGGKGFATALPACPGRHRGVRRASPVGGRAVRRRQGRRGRSTATSGALSRGGERRASRSAAHARSRIRLYPEMQSAHACMTGQPSQIGRPRHAGATPAFEGPAAADTEVHAAGPTRHPSLSGTPRPRTPCRAVATAGTPARGRIRAYSPAHPCVRTVEPLTPLVFQGFPHHLNR